MKDKHTGCQFCERNKPSGQECVGCSIEENFDALHEAISELEMLQCNKKGLTSLQRFLYKYYTKRWEHLMKLAVSGCEKNSESYEKILSKAIATWNKRASLCSSGLSSKYPKEKAGNK
jgi:hypothetical protein